MKLGVNEISKKVAENTGKSSKTCKDIINAALEVIQDTLYDGDSVNLVGYVSFNIEDTPARSGNCAGREWSKPAGKAVKVKLGSKLKNAVE